MDAQATPTPTTHEGEIMKRTTAILLVEDDPACRIPTKIRLERMNYVVGTAANGKAALDWIEEHGEPDVILLDMRMPVMSGPEFMAAYEGTAPIVVLSGWAHEETLPRPAAGTVIKPFVTDELQLAIERALAGSN